MRAPAASAHSTAGLRSIPARVGWGRDTAASGLGEGLSG